jgi:hypothetical protein
MTIPFNHPSLFFTGSASQDLAADSLDCCEATRAYVDLLLRILKLLDLLVFVPFLVLQRSLGADHMATLNGGQMVLISWLLHGYIFCCL